MTVSKSKKGRSLSFVDTKPFLPKKQIIIFGSLISLITSSIAIGYILYVSSPLAQSYFLKLSSFM